LPKKDLFDSNIWSQGKEFAPAAENLVDNFLDNLIVDAVNEYNSLKDRQYDNVREINKTLNQDRHNSASRFPR
jgi:hypothetical protein